MAGRTGMEIMIEKVIRMIGLDPNLVLSKVDEIRKSVSNAAGDLATIRRDQLRIMQHLGIENDEQPSNQQPDERRALNG